MKKNLSIGVYSVIGLTLGLGFYIAFIARNTDVVLTYTIILLSVLFIVARFFFIIFPQLFKRVLLSIITLYCCFETFYGYSQLLGFCHSNNYLFALTGSFENPGPYGGFLAVCICVLGAYAYKNQSSLKKHLWTKIPYLFLLVVVIASLIILPSTQSRTSFLALICSALCFVVKHKQSKLKKIKLFVKKYGIWIAIFSIGLFTSVYLLKKPSADGRLFIDKICIKTICENGLKGAGPRHFGGAYGNTQAQYFENQIKQNGTGDLDWTVIDEKERLTVDCPGNAFNEYLFVGVEYGPIVMFLLLLIIIIAIVVSYKMDGIWCYGLISLAVFAFFSYPFHIKQLQLLFTLLLVACISEQKSANIKTEATCLVVLIVPFLFFFKMIMPEIRNHKQAVDSWNELKQWYKSDYYDFVIEDAESLLPYLKNDHYFLFAYGQSLNKTQRYEESDSILKLGTEISCNPMFWNIIGNNKLALGKVEDAVSYYKQAFYMVPNRLYPLTLIARLYYEEGDSVRFKETAKIVESFIPKIESATTDSLRNEIRQLR